MGFSGTLVCHSVASHGSLLGSRSGTCTQEIPMKSRLRELRQMRGLSQAELAEKLKVSRQTINAIETEKYDPSLPLAFKIARLFRLKIEEIFQEQS
jgi:putative transcriptional regulator